MNMARDQDICHKKRLFRNLFDFRFKAEASAADFYREYRNLLLSCLKKKGDIIQWQNNRELDVDEELSPTFEELILANVLGLIDIRLPSYVMDHYCYESKESIENLMDFQSDILVRVPTFLNEMENNISASSHKREDKPER